MKSLKMFITVLFSVILMGNINAQKKIGVFVHGFNGGSEKWLQESGVPQAWKANEIIDDYVALDYETMELATSSSQAALLNKFVTNMTSKGNPSQDQWILVGHSLGGVISRLLYPKFRESGFNVVAVVSVGGPSQGAAATNVNKYYIDQTISRIKNKIVAAQEHVPWTVSFILSWQAVFAHINGATSTEEQIASIPDYLEVARDTALGYADDVIKSGAKSLIGLDGSLINEINSYDKNNIYQHPQNYISIIGSEKDKAPIRMIGHIFADDDLKDESKNISQLKDLRNKYFSTSEGYYRQLAKRYHWCRTLKGCRDSREYAHYRENLWKEAKLEIDNLGKTWSSMINSYQITTITVPTIIPPCDDAGDGYFLGRFQIQPIDDDEDCSSNPNGEVVYHTEHIQVPDKNDGVVNVHSVLWSKGDNLESTHNFYMNDTDEDGGYNHFELRNHKRAYTLKRDIGSVVFNKGDKNPAMGRAENWIDREL